MPIYTLYVKTHLKTNKKYLGYTRQNPFVYKGSGKHWIRHLKKHGSSDVWTNVLFQTEVESQIKDMGLYYSNLWNIVESTEWLNLKPEQGDGGFFIDGGEISIRNRERFNDPTFAAKFCDTQRELWNRPEMRAARSEYVKKSYTDELRKIRSECTKRQMSDPLVREQRSKQQRDYWNQPENKKRRSEATKLSWIKRKGGS